MPSFALVIAVALTTVMFGCGPPPEQPPSPPTPRVPCPATPCEEALDDLEDDSLFVITISASDVSDENGCFECQLRPEDISHFPWPADLTLEAAVLADPRTPQTVDGKLLLSTEADVGHLICIDQSTSTDCVGYRSLRGPARVVLVAALSLASGYISDTRGEAGEHVEVTLE